MPSTDSTSSLPRCQTAIVAQGPGKLAIQHDAPVPSLAPDMAIVKTAAVAINPVGARILDHSPAAGAIDSYDFAGTIFALGADVLASGRFAVGDRVAGMVHGMNKLQPDVGAFAEYVGACADVLLKLPGRMGFEEAAGLGLEIATAAMGLFNELRVPASFEQLRAAAGVDGEEKELQNRGFVLVAGGAGPRILGADLRPIATCPPSHFHLALQFGAEKVFDDHSPTCAADIRAYTHNQLAYALDCVTQDTTQLCYASIGRAGGRYIALEPFAETLTRTRASTAKPSWLMVLTIFGRKVTCEGEYARDARPQDRLVGAQAFSAVQPPLDRSLIDPDPVKAMAGGWNGVVQRVDLIGKQPLSSPKLVYSVVQVE